MALAYLLYRTSQFRPRYCIADMEGIVVDGSLLHPHLFVALDKSADHTLPSVDNLRQWIPATALGIRMSCVYPAVTLEACLQKDHLARMSQKTRLGLLVELVTTFAYLEEAGIRHNDLHPGNIFVFDDVHICLIDFGTARMYGHKLMRLMMPEEDIEVWRFSGISDLSNLLEFGRRLDVENAVKPIGKMIKMLEADADGSMLEEWLLEKNGRDKATSGRIYGIMWLMVGLFNMPVTFGGAGARLMEKKHLLTPVWIPERNAMRPAYIIDGVGVGWLPEFKRPTLQIDQSPPGGANKAARIQRGNGDRLQGDRVTADVNSGLSRSSRGRENRCEEREA
jgi:hypothetical protein